ncbi:MAG: hypothetical protein OWS03_02125 [Alicyclobacillaceae bacterium]|nr:hypothetical protein [Alicyclobacillaceae bacterium]
MRRRSKVWTVEAMWKPFLSAVEPGRLRRARTSARQGDIVHMKFVDGYWQGECSNTSSVRRIEAFQLRAISDWRPVSSVIARWLAQHPDWLASLISGEWDEIFLQHISAINVAVFPTESIVLDWKQTASCTCADVDPLCRHVVSALLKVMWDMEENPLLSLQWLGCNPLTLLDSIHSIAQKYWSAHRHVQNQQDAKEELCEQISIGKFNEKEISSSVSQSGRRFAPVLDSTKMEYWSNLLRNTDFSSSR